MALPNFWVSSRRFAFSNQKDGIEAGGKASVTDGSGLSLAFRFTLPTNEGAIGMRGVSCLTFAYRLERA